MSSGEWRERKRFKGKDDVHGALNPNLQSSVGEDTVAFVTLQSFQAGRQI